MTITVIIPTTKERRTRIDECLTALKDNAGVPVRILIYENQDGGWVKAVLTAIEDTKGLVYVMNDDMVIQQDCLKILLDNYDNNVVFPDDGINNGTLATTFLCSADYVRENLYSGYSHNYSDTEFTERSKILGKLKYVPEAKLIHKHWTTGAPKDETYTKNTLTWSKDRDLFNERKSHNFYL
jgi:GT2 family glycosyltransferase